MMEICDSGGAQERGWEISVDLDLGETEIYNGGDIAHEKGMNLLTLISLLHFLRY